MIVSNHQIIFFLGSLLSGFEPSLMPDSDLRRPFFSSFLCWANHYLWLNTLLLFAWNRSKCEQNPCWWLQDLRPNGLNPIFPSKFCHAFGHFVKSAISNGWSASLSTLPINIPGVKSIMFVFHHDWLCKHLGTLGAGVFFEKLFCEENPKHKPKLPEAGKYKTEAISFGKFVSQFVQEQFCNSFQT